MSQYFIGIDSGTQSTKTIILDADTGSIEGSASSSYDLLGGLPPGHKEQSPQTWIDAIRKTVVDALAASGIDRSKVRGIGVSGQQHGFVPLDGNDRVIRPAKLWCDTSTIDECDELINALGGIDKTIAALGNGIPPGFTASKILWLKKHEPENYQRLRSILLPHDYINFWLTGRKTMEPGDASGTALFDVRSRDWSPAIINAIDPSILDFLPPIIGSDQFVGSLRQELAAEFSLPADVKVSAGGGDNMMGAIGTGNVRDGVITVSLGTSGTIYSCSSRPVIDPRGEIAAFCDSTGRWLPLVCTMNVTVATEMVRQQFGLSYSQLNDAVGSLPAGNDGLMLLPYFEGERVPNLADATGVYFGLRPQTFTVPHFARAAMEGSTLGLNYGLNRMRDLGIEPVEIRATGGGSRSGVWRQILADVFGVEVVCVSNEEGAAVGAALQAAWALNTANHADESIEDLCARCIRLDETTRARPIAANVARYSAMQELHNGLGPALDRSFSMHRKLIEEIL